MKKINSFIIEKIEKSEENIIELSAKVDSELKKYKVQFDESNFFSLTEMSRELEFLLRANDVALSRNLINFLKKVVENKEFHLPVNLFSESTEPSKSRPRQPQAA